MKNSKQPANILHFKIVKKCLSEKIVFEIIYRKENFHYIQISYNPKVRKQFLFFTMSPPLESCLTCWKLGTGSPSWKIGKKNQTSFLYPPVGRAIAIESNNSIPVTIISSKSIIRTWTGVKFTFQVDWMAITMLEQHIKATLLYIVNKLSFQF